MNSTITVNSKSNLADGIKVAFATNDNENIDAHFGSCQKFVVYNISNDGYEVDRFIHTKEEKSKEGDKTANIVNALFGIDIVYFLDIGPVAAAKVINNKIFPIKYKEIVSIETELEKLQGMLNTNPPPFIKKILESKAA